MRLLADGKTATSSQKILYLEIFQGLRSYQKRSLLEVNEHFENKRNAEKAQIEDFLRLGSRYEFIPIILGDIHHLDNLIPLYGSVGVK